MRSSLRRADILQKIQKIAPKQDQALSLNLDLKLKAQLLSKMELQFQFQIPHVDLNRINTLDEAVLYTQEKLEQIQQEDVEKEQSWENNLPSNVTLDEQGQLDIDGARKFPARYHPDGRRKSTRELRGQPPKRHTPPAWVPREARGDDEW